MSAYTQPSSPAIEHEDSADSHGSPVCSSTPEASRWVALGLEQVCVHDGSDPSVEPRTIGPRVLRWEFPALDMSDAARLHWTQAMENWSGPNGPGKITSVCGPPDNRRVLISETHEALAQHWLMELGVDPGREKFRALACQGAVFHHDAEHYSHDAFFVIWLSDDQGWDLYFPQIDERIALQPGAAVIFDTGLIHGVVQRGAASFSHDDFVMPSQQAGGYLCMELPLADASLRNLLGIETVSPEDVRSQDGSMPSRFPIGVWNLSNDVDQDSDKVNDQTGELLVRVPNGVQADELMTRNPSSATIQRRRPSL